MKRSDVILSMRLAVLGVLLAAATSLLSAQEKKSPPSDSSLIFGTLTAIPPAPEAPPTYRNAWGIDVLVSTNGFGLGTFYRHEYSDDLSGYLDFSVSEAKDDNEVSYVDYFGNSYTPGKVNRFLVLPVYAGIERRLFKDDIMDNFRPFVNAALGPSMIYVFPYNEEYFSALGHGQFKYTVGGYIGLGAYFGSEKSNLLGLNIRYYYIPYPGGLESLTYVAPKKQFGGFYISLNFGSAW